MTDFNFDVFSNEELARLIRNGGLVAGFDTDFNRALVDETARRIEAQDAAIAAAVQAEREACAALAKSHEYTIIGNERDRRRKVANEIARAIRARSY